MSTVHQGNYWAACQFHLAGPPLPSVRPSSSLSVEERHVGLVQRLGGGTPFFYLQESNPVLIPDPSRLCFLKIFFLQKSFCWFEFCYFCNVIVLLVSNFCFCRTEQVSRPRLKPQLPAQCLSSLTTRGSTLQALTHLISIIALWSKFDFYPHFKGEETKAQLGLVTLPQVTR